MQQKSLIQVLGLREYFDQKEQRTKLKHAFFDQKWRARSVKDLFDNLDTILEGIPENERYNLHYTLANCFEKPGRKMDYQHVLPIDIDEMDASRYEEYIPIVLDTLGLEESKTGLVFSGNGLHFIIGLEEPITYEAYFEEHRIYFKVLAGRIEDALHGAGLPAKIDTSIFSRGHMLRLPNTRNVKKDKGETFCRMLQPNVELVPFDLVEKSGIPIVDLTEQISPAMLQHLPKPDTEGVTTGCDFIKWCRDNQETVAEPQWYAMLSIVGRLEDGVELVHEFSNQHPSYNQVETDRKLQQALETAGPRTCDSINTLWDGCASCINWKKCKSPITLQSERYIKTKDTGFHNIVVTEAGPKKGKPNYDDLRMHFENKHPYITMEDSGNVYLWRDNHWQDIGIKYLDSFAEEWFDPKPNNTMCNEFRGKIQRTNIRRNDWFDPEGLINFKNGVLNIETMEIGPTDQELGFKYALPFEYDPAQKAPRFEQFLREITMGDESLQQVLLEYMGYSLSGMDCSLGAKALILSGDGSNGKSVFMDVLKYLGGDGNYTTLSMGREISKPENRYQLDGKLFNISEETPTNAMLDNSIFKALVTGGEVQARKLYCDSYSMKNKAKIIMACNELPPTQDLTFGMMRRLLIVPFNATFTRHVEGFDPFLKEKLFKEASGIYNLVISALQEFIKNRGFSESKTIEAEVQSYKYQNDSILEFINTRLVRDTQDQTAFSKLYQVYRMDCESDGVRPKPRNTFSKSVRDTLRDGEFFRQRKDGKQQLMIGGYRLATKEDDDGV